MLQAPRSSTPSNEFGSFLDEREQGVGELISYGWSFIQRQYLVVLLGVFLSLTIGFLYLQITPPTFIAKAQLIIDTRKSQFLQQQSVLVDAPIDAAQVESQVQVLQSENIALAVTDKLHLAQDLEFVGTTQDGWLRTLRSMALGSERNKKSEPDLTQRAIGTLLNNLDAKRFGMAYIIEISYRSHSPQRAAQVTNEIANAYINDQLESKYQASRRATEWLQDRLQELKQQAAASEQAVNKYRADNNIVAADGKLINDQKVSELNSQLVLAKARTSEAQARLDRINLVLRASGPDFAIDATVSDTLSSPIVTKLRQQYLELVGRQNELSARLGRDHLAVVHIRSQMRDIRQSIVNELQRLAETYKSDYAIAKQRQDNLEKDLAASISESQATNTAQVTLRELEGAAQGARALYDLFQKRYLEAIQQQSFPITEARVISPATVPTQQSSPKVLVVLGLSGLLGLGLGGGIGFARESSGSSISDWRSGRSRTALELRRFAAADQRTCKAKPRGLVRFRFRKSN